MKIIYKYHLTDLDHGWSMSLSIGSKDRPLTVQLQREHLQLWVEHDTESTHDVTLDIEAVGTGIEYKGNLKNYLCTVQDGALVWHFFYAIR